MFLVSKSVLLIWFIFTYSACKQGLVKVTGKYANILANLQIENG